MIIKFLCCEYFSQKEKEIKLLLWDKFNIHTRPALKKKKKKKTCFGPVRGPRRQIGEIMK